MSNLLDKASIILTPTAYNNGEALCVKPSDGSGDFDFSRNSAATRVNAQGLVENVQILSSNLVQNGDFATDSDWAKVNSTISGGKGNLDSTSGTSLLFQSALVVGKTYKGTLDVTNYNGLGTCALIDSNGVTQFEITSNGSKEFNFTQGGSSSNLSFRAISGGIFSIDNVSVREVTDDTNLPRINYEAGCGSWLFEPQTTQNVIYSEDFSQWTTSGDTTIESGYLAPDGTNNAYKVSGTNGILALTGTINTTSTRTIYARTVSGTGQAHLCSISSNTNNLFTITEQWQRFEVNSAVATGASNFYAVDFRNLTNLSEIILWGANATNDQDYATSYIPTSGSSVTRNQDVCTNGGSLASINSTEGVLYAEIAALANDGTLRRLSLSDGTNNNRVLIGYNAANTIQFVIQSLGAIFVNQTFTLTDITQFSKIAFKYKENDCSFWIDGVKVGTDTIAAMPIGLNQALFAQGFTNEPFFGNTKALAVFPYLSDAELTELTTI